MKKQTFRLQAPPEGYNNDWLYLWGFVAIVLLALIFLIPFEWWAVCAIVGFGTLEGYGLFGGNPRLPPLTDVISEFVPYWATLAVIGVFMGAASAVWHVWKDSGHHPLRIGLWLGLLLWFIAHFTERYSS